MVSVPLLVLGSRVTGLATGLFLAHQGFPVHVLERDRPEHAEPHRAAITPDALRELAVLGLAEAVEARAWEPTGLVHADAETGAVLRRAQLGATVRRRFGRPFLLVPRPALRALLVAACEADEMVTVEYGRTATAIEDLGDSVLVTADHGRTYRAEALIGADGPASRVRTHLGGGHPVSTPYVQHRAAAPTPPTEEVRIWSCPTLHVAQLRSGGGAGEVTLTLRVDSLDEMRRETVEAMVARRLAALAAPVREAAAAAVTSTGSRVFRQHAPLQRWTRHRMTVVGCAAQPMLPHDAQSVSQALLDAAALGRAFDHADGRILPALAEYAGTRAPARHAAALAAHDFATLCHADGLLRRTRDRLWRGDGVDTTAAVVGAHSPRWPPGPPDGPGPVPTGMTGMTVVGDAAPEPHDTPGPAGPMAG